MTSDPLRLTIPRETSAFAKLTPAVTEFLEERRVPGPVRYKVHLALEELILNLIEHGKGGSDQIDLEMIAAADRFILTVIDDGEPFDPREAPALDTASSLEARRAGGMGLHLLRTMASDIDYQRLDDRNRVIVRLDYEK